jgi:hypothetical protein
MKNLAFSRAVCALAGLASLAWAAQCHAVEPGDTDPHQPGAAAGAPLAALPPPGFYFVNNFNYVSGSLDDGNGNVNKAPAHTAVNVTAYVEIPVLTWSSPFHILGAQYGATLLQPIVTNSATTTSVSPITHSLTSVTTNKTGLDNTAFSPLVLSWHLPAGFFAAISTPIAIDDGDNEAHAKGGTSVTPHNAADYWIFSPSAYLAWFNGHGTQLSVNAEYDIQTKDNNFLNVGGSQISYQSGDFLTLDFGALQTLPGVYHKWSVGIVGSFATQTTDDTLSGNPAALAAVGAAPGRVPANFLNLGNSAGNRFQSLSLGPSVFYEFGPIVMNLYYTRDLFAKNTASTSTVWFAFAIPL